MRTGRPPTPAIDRFWPKVKKLENGCWRWIAQIDEDGYGRFYWDDRIGGYAHQFAYQHFVGPLDPTLTVDHKCRHRWCVNPKHLRQIPNLDNVMTGVGVGAVNARKTHCSHGHPFTPENTYRDKRGYRGCKICRARRSKIHNQKHGAQHQRDYCARHHVYWSSTHHCYVPSP
jgi:hypothetical protein